MHPWLRAAIEAIIEQRDYNLIHAVDFSFILSDKVRPSLGATATVQYDFEQRNLTVPSN